MAVDRRGGNRYYEVSVSLEARKVVRIKVSAKTIFFYNLFMADQIAYCCTRKASTDNEQFAFRYALHVIIGFLNSDVVTHIGGASFP